MEKQFLTFFDSMSDAHEAIFKAVSKLSHEEFNRKSESGKWSIAQIMEHLYMAEKFSLQYMQKKMLGRNKLVKAGLMSKLKSAVLNICLRSSIKFKAPSITNPYENQHDVNEFVESWKSQDEQFKQFVNDFPTELMFVEIFKHPVVGKLNMMQTLEFMAIHATRHKNQILERLP